jgi:hypothetical protein
MADPVDFIFRSALPDADIPFVSLPEFVSMCIAKNGDQEKAAYIDGPTGRTYSFGQVITLVKKVAAGLAERGIKQHDVVMILAPNLPEVSLSLQDRKSHHRRKDRLRAYSFDPISEWVTMLSILKLRRSCRVGS